MDYKDLYEQLIQLRKTEQLVKSKEQAGMIESHHILPRCCGGTDDPNNIVNLYAKEHFMAHYYLWKMHENDEFKYPLLNALWMMCTMGSTFQDRSYQEYVKMSGEYQEARIQFIKQLSDTMSDKVSGSKNGQFGKHWYYDPLTNESHRYVDGQQPIGWKLGRVPKKQRIKKIEQRRKDTIKQIELTSQFSACTNTLYNGVVNRRQVRFFLEYNGKNKCNRCEKSNEKLIVHAIDGNCKNLSINNYEFLCRECYLASGTAGFSGRSMADINKKKQNNAALGE